MRPPTAERIIFLKMAFGKQVTAGHCHSEGQLPLLPIGSASQVNVLSL